MAGVKFPKEIVPKLIQSDSGVNGKTADVVLPDYHNYTELVAELEQLADSYTTTSQLYIQGSTVEGRQLAVIRISGDVQQVGNHCRTEERGVAVLWGEENNGSQCSPDSSRPVMWRFAVLDCTV